MNVPLPDLTKEIFDDNAYPARYVNGRLGLLNDDYPTYVSNSDGLFLRSLYAGEWSKHPEAVKAEALQLLDAVP